MARGGGGFRLGLPPRGRRSALLATTFAWARGGCRSRLRRRRVGEGRPSRLNMERRVRELRRPKSPLPKRPLRTVWLRHQGSRALVAPVVVLEVPAVPAVRARVVVLLTSLPNTAVPAILGHE
eukprot:2515757-Pyramimonas_sp.AAC.1